MDECDWCGGMFAHGSLTVCHCIQRLCPKCITAHDCPDDDFDDDYDDEPFEDEDCDA